MIQETSILHLNVPGKKWKNGISEYVIFISLKY